MERDPVTDVQAALAQRISRMVAGTAGFKAPHDLVDQVLGSIERRVKVPWWQRRVMEWPRLAQLGFALTGVATAAALLLGRPAAPKALHAVIPQAGAVLRQPAADLHTTLNVLSVFHRLTDTIAGSLPDAVWYGGMALCAAAYLALFFLIVFGYRLLQAPAASR
jgi:hypothetical protein